MHLGCANADYCYIIAPGNPGLALNNNLLLTICANIGNATYPVGTLSFNYIDIKASYNQIRALLKVAFRNADNSATWASPPRKSTS